MNIRSVFEERNPTKPYGVSKMKLLFLSLILTGCTTTSLNRDGVQLTAICANTGDCDTIATYACPNGYEILHVTEDKHHWPLDNDLIITFRCR